ncbi:MAG: SulP family inorganic anion transporter [Chloroflexi bacterium]|nr:SulP family inorganic anion transporter [Chloroflexota bacterium]MDL1882612.1 SulP family inorganic anion transporter [Anaerolineae bacterium CFX8]
MHVLRALPNLFQIWRDEFRGYNGQLFRRDLLAGITVAAVALPLALAFGVASGATAAAGLVTAILAGFIIGGLGGAGYQISGPTGAMSAVLIVLASRYGIEGVWTAGVIAGGLILLMGVFNLGQIVNFIPSAVIAGFTSGIAVIIFIGQLDNLLGVTTEAAENALVKLTHYFRFDYTPNIAAVGLSALVILLMVFWPKRLNARFPGSLLGLIVATAAALLLHLDIPVIGAVPQTILLDQRLLPAHIPWQHIGDLIMPALSIAALGSIESLLCGTVAGRMTGTKMVSGQELIAQGVGNIIIPFFGGVPATAAIARTSVAIKSGGKTRVMSLVHSAALLLAALVLAPVIAHVPLAALAGVLAVTAWRMNEWGEIREIFRRRFKSAMFAFVSTLIATVALDLTQAIILGIGLSAMIFVFQISRIKVIFAPVSVEKMRADGYEMQYDANRIMVVYIMGPLFFGTASTFNAALENLNGNQDIILSLRTVPLLDTTGISAIENLIERLEKESRRIYLSGLTDPVRSYLERAGVIQHLGENRVFWSAYEAIMAADHYRANIKRHTEEYARLKPAPGTGAA